MLKLKPNCELCDVDLPPNSSKARICSYECTYCVVCVGAVLHNVCPTCGGGFERRPIRPRKAWRLGLRLGLSNHPASRDRVATRWTIDEIKDLVDRVAQLHPTQR